jgi:dipeptidyl aminopeptidase/acylaminoacyl peptidase
LTRATAYRGDIGLEGDLSINLGDVNDILAAIEYLKSKSYVDTSRIGMFGESRGGASTLLAAERTSDLKAVVSWYPYTNIATYCDYIGVDVCLALYGSAREGGKNIIPFGLVDYQHLVRVASAVNFASKLTMPLQNSHGTADFVVPYSQSEELNVVMAGKTDYTFYSYEGADHGFKRGLGNNRGDATPRIF